MTTMQTPAPALADLISDTPLLWMGASGEQVTGEQVARHLEATAALLARDGWTRASTDTDEPQVEDGASVRDMLRGLLRWMTADQGPWMLRLAMVHIAGTDDGDMDTCEAARQVCELVLRARTGARYAETDAWASRLGRTWPEVRELLTEAAAAARTYGPRS